MFANLTYIIECMYMFHPCWFAPSVYPGIPSSILLASPRNVPLLFCKVGIVSVLALISHITGVADTDLVTVCTTIPYGVPGCACGFTVFDATTAPCTSASLRGEIGDDGKEPGDLGVARRERVREEQVGDDNPLNGVIILEGGNC